MNIRDLQRLLGAMESAGFTQREMNSERLRAAVLSIERAAREECAQLCERRAQKVSSVTRHSEGHALAAAIRALREGKQ